MTTLSDIESAITNGVNYHQQVKTPLLALEPESPGDTVVISDILKRLEPYERKHLQKNSVLGNLDKYKDIASQHVSPKLADKKEQPDL